MDKQAIIEQLVKRHDAFIQKIASLSDEDFLRNPAEKWNAGQQLDHIIKSVARTDMAFGLPLFVLEGKFGFAERPSKSYQDLVNWYLQVLEENKGYVLPEAFAPEEIAEGHKQKNLERLHKLVEKLCYRIENFSEEELNTYMIPHPVMGKLTLLEMLYFTIYHVQHHDRQILTNLELI